MTNQSEPNTAPEAKSAAVLVIAGVVISGEDLLAVYNALAQWSDNESVGLEEGSDPITEGEKRTHKRESEAVARVQGVVAKLEVTLFNL